MADPVSFSALFGGALALLAPSANHLAPWTRYSPRDAGDIMLSLQPLGRPGS